PLLPHLNSPLSSLYHHHPTYLPSFPTRRSSDLMLRRYDRDRYLDVVAALRGAVPGIALTTDIIVGFPGETEDDFSETLSLVEQRSEEHTSELQSRFDLVCRLLLEKKKIICY